VNEANNNDVESQNERRHMNELLRLTQLLYSCWIVSDDAGGAGKESMPTGRGVMEYALRDAVDRGAFPEWARNQLHFVSGDGGLACLELPLIQKLATEIKLTSDPNPSYTRTNIVVGIALARRCLAKLEISEEQARLWGKTLREASAKAEAELAVAESA
jgi:hypothetical protein